MQMEEKIIIAGIIATALVLSIGAMVVLNSNSVAAAYLKIDVPKTGDRTIAGQFLTVLGTSIPSNATRTHCTVLLKTNNDTYRPVTPTAKDGTFTNWKALTSMAILPGNNQVEAKFQCFAPNSNFTIPNFVHHLTHNFTGGATLGGPAINTTTKPTTAAAPPTPTPPVASQPNQGNSLLNTTQ
jgi:hypothetical protein